MTGNDGWRQVISDAVTARAAASAANSPGTSAGQRMSRVAFSPEANHFLVRAANARGITLSGYVRRATMVQIALDLGIDPQVLFELDAPIRRKGYAKGVRDLDGTLFGLWGCQE